MRYAYARRGGDPLRLRARGPTRGGSLARARRRAPPRAAPAAPARPDVNMGTLPFNLKGKEAGGELQMEKKMKHAARTEPATLKRFLAASRPL